MRILILAQEDVFFLPMNIDKVCDVADVVGIVNVTHKSALQNRLSDFFAWFGIWQFVKMGVKTAFRKVLGVVDRLSGYRFYAGHCGIHHVAKKRGIPYCTVENVNKPDFFRIVSGWKPDLIVSFSAPQVIKEPLLSYPRFGIINVHGSLLPDYRGCLPSFWYLYNGERLGGATVHYMSAAIDDGDIILQETIDISTCRSMFELMRMTKLLGGELIIKAIKQIEAKTVTRHTNDPSKGRYFSWPQRQQGREFLAMGKRLI